MTTDTLDRRFRHAAFELGRALGGYRLHRPLCQAKSRGGPGSVCTCVLLNWRKR